MHGTPLWLTRKTLSTIETKPGQNVFALMDRLQRLDERVGCAGGTATGSGYPSANS